jgi:hypothetical protein
MTRSSAVLRSIGLAGAAAVLVVTAVAAAGAAHDRSLALKALPGTAGNFLAVSAAPHSSDLWVTGENRSGSVRFVARRHNGKWQRKKVPAGLSLATIAAGSAKVVWAGGTTPTDAPWLGRWHGTSMRAVTLAGINAFGSINSISASSANNAWAVGRLNTASPPSAAVAEHWNGKTWKAAPLPAGVAQLENVSTSSPTNAWAISSGPPNTIVHWNGTSWKVSDTAPTSVSLDSIATSSPKRAVAVGSIVHVVSGIEQPKTYILRLNGSTWAHVPSPNPFDYAFLNSVTMHGTSVWAVGAAVDFETVRNVVLHSTGGKWRSQSSELPPGALAGVSAESVRRVDAVGGRGPDDALRTALTVYNGHVWKPQPAKI